MDPSIFDVQQAVTMDHAGDDPDMPVRRAKKRKSSYSAAQIMQAVAAMPAILDAIPAFSRYVFSAKDDAIVVTIDSDHSRELPDEVHGVKVIVNVNRAGLDCCAGE